MLRAPLLRRRSIWPIWTGHEAVAGVRSYGAKRPSKRERERLARKEESNSKGEEQDAANEASKPSLMEQLFPEETKRYEEEKRQREIPRLPLEPPPERKPQPADRITRPVRDELSPRAKAWRRHMEQQSQGDREQTAVLVMRNASKNLTEEDFRRLIPQGQHMEGWTLEQAEFVKVVPGRNLANLEQQNYYYLIFSSPLSAALYQGHASRVSRLVAEQTPNSLHSAIPPPPGYMLDGMDAHAAMQAYTLTPPTQRLSLRQLKPPLSPLMTSIVRNNGYAPLIKRRDRMPYEVRLTLEGPQIAMNRIRYIIYESGRERALSWSGGEEMNVQISRWEAHHDLSAPQARSGQIETAIGNLDEQDEEQEKMDRHAMKAGNGEEGLQRRRTEIPVYVLGFHTEHAARSFVAHWHRRPLELGKGGEDEEGDLPPVVNAELLW